MPRDAAGNYTLPPGNPVIPHEIIETDWANPTMDDIAAALTDSLSRTGSGGMMVPFKNADGLVNAPGISWVNEPTSGWYRAGLNDFWYSVGNENIFRITKTGIELGPGKIATNLLSLIKVQDDEPTVPATRQGEQWFEADTGALYMRYQNPDLTYTWIQINTVGGDWMPASNLDAMLVNAADDIAAAAAGVAIGHPYRTGNLMKVRVV
jgi:hypothetical protein